MQVISSHIKEKKFKPVYLIYGTEDYLKKQYKGKLKVAVLGESDDMNYSYFEGKDADVVKITDAINTLPFFNDKRVVVVENSGLFKSANTLSDHVKEMPETTVLVFVEKEVDKRNKLFKTVKDIGYISEMNGVDEASLKRWVAGKLKAENKKITGATLDCFLAKTGGDMELISSELEKLICYTMDQEVISTQDVEEVVITQITSQIFLMIDAIASKNQEKALSLYYDLIALKERPTSILYLITRHFNILLQVKELYRLRTDNMAIAKRVSIPPFAVNKYLAQGRNFKRKTLLEAVEFATEIEEQIKTGRLNEKMGVEMLIVKYSTADN